MKKPSTIDTEIKRLEELLTDSDPLSKEYYRTIAQIGALRDIQDRNRKFRFDVSGDTIVIAGVNLAGILIILHHETLNAISSKALGFVTKLRF